MGELNTAARSSTIESVLPHYLEISAQELVKFQETDNTLVKIWEAASKFFKEEGLIYGEWRPSGLGEESELEQLVLSKECR